MRPVRVAYHSEGVDRWIEADNASIIVGTNLNLVLPIKVLLIILEAIIWCQLECHRSLSFKLQAVLHYDTDLFTSCRLFIFDVGGVH